MKAEAFNIWDASELAESFNIYVNGNFKATIFDKKYSLGTLGISKGSYQIYVISSADGYSDSKKSNTIAYKDL